MRLFLRSCGWICVWLLLVTGSLKAAEKGDDSLIRVLEAGGYEQIKQVAKQIHDDENYSIHVLDVLAAVVFQSYEVPDLRVIDTLAWGCRVLGESKHYRYWTIVNEMGMFAPNAKLRDYCFEAAQEITQANQNKDVSSEHVLMPEDMSLQPVWYTDSKLPVQHVSYRIYPEPLRNQMMASNLERIEVLRAGGRRHVAKELKKIHSDKGKTPFEINEAVAEIIWKFVEGTERLSNDAVSWACKAVAVSRSNRYHDLIYNAVQRGHETSNSIAEHCRLAYDYVSAFSETEQFKPGYFLTHTLSEEAEEEVSDLKSIREQLTILKQLHAEGLIDKQTYDMKRESILAEL